MSYIMWLCCFRKAGSVLQYTRRVLVGFTGRELESSNEGELTAHGSRTRWYSRFPHRSGNKHLLGSFRWDLGYLFTLGIHQPLVAHTRPGTHEFLGSRSPTR